MKKTEWKTEWKIVAINETAHWHDDIVARAGRLYGIYLFDANRRTYCCELTPSYELEFIETVNEKDHSDELNMLIMDANAHTDPVSYYHCRSIDALEARWFCTFPNHAADYDTDEEWEAERDDMLEFLRGNQYVPKGVPYVADAEEAA